MRRTWETPVPVRHLDPVDRVQPCYEVVREYALQQIAKSRVVLRDIAVAALDDVARFFGTREWYRHEIKEARTALETFDNIDAMHAIREVHWAAALVWAPETGERMAQSRPRDEIASAVGNAMGAIMGAGASKTACDMAMLRCVVRKYPGPDHVVTDEQVRAAVAALVIGEDRLCFELLELPRSRVAELRDALVGNRYL